MFSTQLDSSSLNRPEVVLGSSLLGAATFPSMLALGQRLIFRPLRVTAGRGLISTVLGGASVCVAGFAASLATVKSCCVISSLISRDKEERNNTSLHFSTPELLASTVSSVFVFRALGGRFYSVLPSHLMYPGAFAREWLPAIRGVQSASAIEREVIQTFGKKHGCHTCGRKRVSSFVCDHQPPSKIVNNNSQSINNIQHSSQNHANHVQSNNVVTSSSPRNGTVGQMANSQMSSTSGSSNLTQRFYPQCHTCSSSQGGLLSLNKASSASAIRTHPLSLRAYHLFLPIPLALLYLKSPGQPFIFGGKSDQSDSRIVSRPANDVVAVHDESTQTPPTTNEATPPSKPATSSSSRLQTLIRGSSISDLVDNFPLLIVWMKIVSFLESFKNPGDAFHMTLWAFTIIAALGTI